MPRFNDLSDLPFSDDTLYLNGITIPQPRSRTPKPSNAPKGRGSEHAEQAALIAMAAAHEAQYPDLALLYAIPNGGARHPAVAGKLRAEGVKAGMPDLCLPVARGDYIGMYVEMKYGKNKPGPAQVQWIAALRRAGHHVTVCYSAEDALRALITYLELEPPLC